MLPCIGDFLRRRNPGDGITETSIPFDSFLGKPVVAKLGFADDVRVIIDGLSVKSGLSAVFVSRGHLVVLRYLVARLPGRTIRGFSCLYPIIQG